MRAAASADAALAPARLHSRALAAEHVHSLTERDPPVRQGARQRVGAAQLGRPQHAAAGRRKARQLGKEVLECAAGRERPAQLAATSGSRRERRAARGTAIAPSSCGAVTAAHLRVYAAEALAHAARLLLPGGALTQVELRPGAHLRERARQRRPVGSGAAPHRHLTGRRRREGPTSGPRSARGRRRSGSASTA